MQSSQAQLKITNSIDRVKTSEGVHLNNWLVIKQIGEGPYAKIKLIEDLNDNKKQYAMKKFCLYLLKKKTRMIRDKDGNNKYISIVQDVQAEVALTSQLRHTNVIQTFQVMRNAQNEKLYMSKQESNLVMQYCSLGDIALWNSKKHCYVVKPQVQQPLKLTKILLGVLHGLKYLHENGIVHRDLKPSNILLNSKYVPKIIDFGRAVKLQEPTQLLKGSEGTYHFMSPEMLSEKQKQGYDGRKSDIWSLGVTIYCIVTQKLPFDAEPIMKLFQSIDVSKFQYPSNHKIPPHIRSIIDGCIVHNPKSRLSIQQMISICQKYIAENTVDSNQKEQ